MYSSYSYDGYSPYAEIFANNSATTSSDIGQAIFIFILGILGIVAIIMAIVLVLQIIGMWKVFTKAGEKAMAVGSELANSLGIPVPVSE